MAEQSAIHGAITIGPMLQYVVQGDVLIGSICLVKPGRIQGHNEYARVKWLAFAPDSMREKRFGTRDEAVAWLALIAAQMPAEAINAPGPGNAAVAAVEAPDA